MKITTENKIGELVAEDYRLATVFKKFGIDYCCKGQRSIAEACEGKPTDVNALLNALNQLAGLRDEGETDVRAWPLDLLTDYIEKKHHRYVEDRLPELLQYLDKLCRVHGAAHPELHAIRQLFAESAADLSVHMKKEELVLFPYIRRLVNGQRTQQEVAPPHFGTIENPVRMMRADHDTEGERFRRIAELSGNYTPPADACNTYQVTYKLLQEFENDLHRHVHLENNILFPAAIRLEEAARTVTA